MCELMENSIYLLMLYIQSTDEFINATLNMMSNFIFALQTWIVLSKIRRKPKVKVVKKWFKYNIISLPKK